MAGLVLGSIKKQQQINMVTASFIKPSAKPAAMVKPAATGSSLPFLGRENVRNVYPGRFVVKFPRFIKEDMSAFMQRAK